MARARIKFIAYALLILFIFSLNGCRSSQSGDSEAFSLLKADATSQPSDLIILITIDTWRHDAFGAVGAPVKTPNIDSLAKEGVIFNNAFAHSVVTLPSHASILTGLYAHQHGLRDNAGFRLDEKTQTLAHHLKNAGYETAAFVSAYPLDSRYGLGSGFDLYDDSYDAYKTDNIRVPERPGEITLKRASDWLNNRKSGKQFVWVHLYEPHFPYIPPEPFRSTYSDNAYYGEIAYADSLLGPLLENIRNSNKDVTLAITSDHGESLGEHGELTHGVFAYNATLKIPLILWAPQKLIPGKVSQRARHVDLLPSILALSGLPVPNNIAGSPLFARNREVDTSYFESLSTHLNRGWAPLRGCLDDDFKAIELPVPELYDLNADPHEQNNLAETDPERTAVFLNCLPLEPGLGDGRSSLSADEIENLQALGYVSSSLGSENETDPKSLDPKFLMDADKRFHEALAIYQSGNLTGAIQALTAIIETQPHMLTAYLHLSDFYDESGRLDLAIETMKNALRNGVRNESAFRKLALFLTSAGEVDEAYQLMKGFAQSKDPETHSTLGKIFSAYRRFEQAKHHFELAMKLDEANPQAHADMGTLYLMAQQKELARSYFERALSLNDHNAEAWNGLGVVKAESDPEGAVAAWENAVKYDSKLAFCYFNLGLFYQKMGKDDLAVQRLQTYATLVSGPQKQKALEIIENIQEK